MNIAAYDDDHVRAYAKSRKYRGLFEIDLDRYLHHSEAREGYAFMYTKAVDEINELGIVNLFEKMPSSLFKARYIIGINESSDLSSYKKVCDTVRYLYSLISLPTEYATVEEWGYGEKNQLTFVFLGVPVTEVSLEELSDHPLLEKCAKEHVRKKRLLSLFD